VCNTVYGWCFFWASIIIVLSEGCDLSSHRFVPKKQASDFSKINTCTFGIPQRARLRLGAPIASNNGQSQTQFLTTPTVLD
jgi:hypothetical protein